MKLHPLSLLLGCLLLLSACNRELDVPARGTIRFTFDTETEPVSERKSTRVDENNVQNIHILVYNQRGRRVGYDYFTAANNYRLEVPVGSGYTVYAIANTGNPTLFDDSRYNVQSALIEMTTPPLFLWVDIEQASHLLLSGMQTDIRVTPSVPGHESDTQVSLTLTRLVARITLNVGTEPNSGIAISNFQVFSLPRISYYLPRPLGGYPEFENEIFDTYPYPGDDASRNDTDADWTDAFPIQLAQGSTAFGFQLYCYENRQGVNPAITRQRDKNIHNAPLRASYLLVKGTAPGYTSMNWRIYFGANATANFNIKRNATYNYNIILRATETDMRVEYQRQ
ncbi:MAG: DUF4906 domain-containing protein [Prevotellaceae bacterium]|jgi:hypothetical protein|nr:DUF4906 domain-containing protein [Prevotellaceae bacterium]